MRRRSYSTSRLRVSQEERTALEQLLRTGRTGIWAATRARAVLLAATGQSISATAREVRRDRKWVRLWLRRFQKLRISGLRDSPRSGRPPKFSPRRAA